jgi:hypothetical protein
MATKKVATNEEVLNNEVTTEQEAEREPVKPIIIHDDVNKRDYTLEFNRESVSFAEMHGFKTDDIDECAMTRIPELFYYAFRMHHMNVSREKTDKILFEDLGGATPELIERLAQLFTEPYRALYNATGKSKNPRVTMEL